MNYRAEVRVLDNGNLQAQCFVKNEMHWSGVEQDQNHNLMTANEQANAELNAHVRSSHR